METGCNSCEQTADGNKRRSENLNDSKYKGDDDPDMPSFKVHDKGFKVVQQSK